MDMKGRRAKQKRDWPEHDLNDPWSTGKGGRGRLWGRRFSKQKGEHKETSYTRSQTHVGEYIDYLKMKQKNNGGTSSTNGWGVGLV